MLHLREYYERALREFGSTNTGKGILFFIIHSFTAASYFHPFQKVAVCSALVLAVMQSGAYFFCAIKCRTLQRPSTVSPGSLAVGWLQHN